MSAAPVQPDSRVDDWLTLGRFAALLGLLVFAAYPQVFLGLQTFTYRDFGYFSYPNAAYFRESFWRGEIPLWNPLSNCGLPFLAQWNTQVLYPPALFYLVFPLAWALPVFCLLHLYLGGLGMFWLARRWTASSFAAAFAGIVFAFSGLMLNSLMWPPMIPALAWMPWVVWLAERAWREGGRVILLAALAGALQMLSGGVEAILLTWALLGVMSLAEIFRGELARWRTLWRAGLVVMLVAGLCAAQLLPFLDFIRHSHRQADFDAATWPMPVTGWANFLVPLFLTHRTYHGPFLQVEQAWTSSYYVGALTVALAVWAVWRARNRRVVLLAALALVCLVLALGDATPLYRSLRQHVGLVNLMRFPVKFVILPVFALPLLAAFALAKEPRWSRQKSGWGVIGLTLAALLSLAWLAWRWNDKPSDGAASAWNGLHRALLFAALVALLACAERATPEKRRRLLHVVALILAWLDVSHHAPQPQTVNPAVYEPTLPRSLPPPRFGTARAMVSPEAFSEFNNSVIPDPFQDYASRRFALFCNCNLLEDIPKPDGFFPLKPGHHQLFWQLLYGKGAPDPPPAPLLDFLGIAQITAPGKIFDWAPRDSFLPLLTGGQRPLFDGEAAMMKALVSTNFNPRAEVHLPREARAAITATNTASVRITDARFAAHHLEANVRAGQPAMIVVAQTFHANWRAYVDDKPTPLFRANLAFQAFQVPAGSHRVRLRYEDRQFFLGAAVSLAALLGWTIAWFALVRTAPPPAPGR